MHKQAGRSPAMPMDILPYIKPQMVVKAGRCKFSEGDMKSKWLPFLLLFTTACTFQVEVFGTPTPQSTAAVLLPYATATSNAALSTLTPLSTSTALPSLTPNAVSPTVVLPSPVLATLPADGVLPIQFEANGTGASVFGSTDAGSSKMYSLTAFGGQIMSVS